MSTHIPTNRRKPIPDLSIRCERANLPPQDDTIMYTTEYDNELLVHSAASSLCNSPTTTTTNVGHTLSILTPRANNNDNFGVGASPTASPSVRFPVSPTSFSPMVFSPVDDQITLHNVRSRILYNTEHNVLLADFSRLVVKCEQHVETIREALLECLRAANERLSPTTTENESSREHQHEGHQEEQPPRKLVNVIVTYDDFQVETEALMHMYRERVIQFFTENYYKSIQRYTTKTFLYDRIQQLNECIGENSMANGPIIQHNVQVIGDRYVVDHVLGEGAFGKVALALDKRTMVRVAIKEVNLTAYGDDALLNDCLKREELIMKQISFRCLCGGSGVSGARHHHHHQHQKSDSADESMCQSGDSGDGESAVMAMMNHSGLKEEYSQFLIKLLDYIVDKPNQTIYIIMEYCAKGPLETPMDEHEQFDEQRAHKYFVQIVCGLQYLHEKYHVVHRDLQLANICLMEDDNVKICDFGVSDWFLKSGEESCESNDYGKTLNLFTGNVAYASPEMLLQKNYGCDVDVWSAGVCLYKMVVGYLPFKGRGHALIGQFYVPLDDEELDHLSDDLKDLISKILNPNMQQRYSTIEQIKSHPWFTKYHYDFV